MFQSGSPYRFHISTNQWQCVAKLSAQCNLPQSSFCNKAAAVFRSLIYVLHGRGDECEVNRTFKHIHGFSPTWKPRVADLFCFDPKKNEWEQKASTSTSHFGSSLLVVNDKLYVAGGNCSIGIFEPSTTTLSSKLIFLCRDTLKELSLFIVFLETTSKLITFSQRSIKLLVGILFEFFTPV